MLHIKFDVAIFDVWWCLYMFIDNHVYIIWYSLIPIGWRSNSPYICKNPSLSGQSFPQIMLLSSPKNPTARTKRLVSALRTPFHPRHLLRWISSNINCPKLSKSTHNKMTMTRPPVPPSDAWKWNRWHRCDEPLLRRCQAPPRKAPQSCLGDQGQARQ